MSKVNEVIEVCDKRDAGTIIKTRKELDELNREHPDNYSIKKICEVYGC